MPERHALPCPSTLAEEGRARAVRGALHGLGAAALLALLPALPAAAQTGPYYIGVLQSFTHDSNIVRLRDDQPAPPGISKSDTVSTTALVAGLDQPLGRGRLFGQAQLRDTRFADNGQYDSNGYSLNLGLDLATIERITGQLAVNAARTPRASVRDRNEQPIPGRNVERTQGASARASVGLVTQWSAELGVSQSKLEYSAPAAAFREYDQTSTTAGVAWRPGAATRLSVGIGRTRTDYPNLLFTLADPNDRRTRDSVDLGASWQPTGVSRLDASLSRGKTRHQRFGERDFDATFGSLGWNWRPTGKLAVDTRLSRDTGQDSDVITTAFSRTTDQLRVQVGYELSAKVSLSLTAGTNRRTLDGTAQVVSGVTGTDNGRNLELGVRWLPLRSLSTGCTVGSERRGRNSNPLLVDPYRSSSVSCFGQFVLQ
jgi:hypothetical protein